MKHREPDDRTVDHHDHALDRRYGDDTGEAAQLVHPWVATGTASTPATMLAASRSGTLATRATTSARGITPKCSGGGSS